MITDIMITSLETITAFDLLTGNLKFCLDELQSATIANAEEKTDITGKGGRKLSTLKKNKSFTVSGTNGMVSSGMLEVQSGSAFANKATVVKWCDVLSVTSNTATINYTAVGTTGNEISAVYVKTSEGKLGEILTQGTEAASGVFTYTPTGKKLTFSGLADGTEVVVYYDRKIQADVMDVMSDTYSGKVALYIDALAEDKCNNVYRVQIYVPKADFSGEFSMDLGDNQTVHNFEAESLAGSCGSAGSLWTWTIFGADAKDAA